MCDAAATTIAATPQTAAAAAGAANAAGPATGAGAGASDTGTATAAATASVTVTAMEEQNQRTRQGCCRLCIAPASECISIINSYAADKEPLATKIHNCVNIKVSR